MTWKDFSTVTRIKVDGTLALYRAFAPHLDFFIMLSSIAGVVGSSGQVNYNAGNAVQDIIAQTGNDRSPSCCFISLNIGWVEDAHIFLNHETRKNAVRRAGIIPVDTKELLQFFNYALDAAVRKDSPPQIVIGIDHVSLQNSVAVNGSVRSPLFCHVRYSRAAAETEQEAEPEKLSFTELATAGDRNSIVEFIANETAARLAHMISIDSSQIDKNHTSILAIGLDSLVAIELRNWIMREFDAPLQSSELLSDQTIHAIAEKVATRSRILSGNVNAAAHNGEATELPVRERPSHLASSELVSPNLSTTDPSTGTKATIVELEAVPIPTLENTLEQFAASRRPFETTDEQRLTSRAVQGMLSGIGPTLQRRLQDESPDTIADSLERQIYLERRDPLQDYSMFSVVHPLDGPNHTQALRAAVLTVAAIEFVHRLGRGEVAPDTLHGVTLSDQARGWLFYANRRPGFGADCMERFPASEAVAVLRRGHVFQLSLPSAQETLSLSSVHASYQDIIRSSEVAVDAFCTMTADSRDAWASVC